MIPKTRLSLIIKGFPSEALNHVARHGVPYRTFYATNHGETVVETEPLLDCTVDAIISWFCRDGDLVIPGKGYPVGTLLLYTFLPAEPPVPPAETWIRQTTVQSRRLTRK